jgi:hypothetical protein
MSERKMENNMKNEGQNSMGNMIHDAKDKVEGFIRNEKIDDKIDDKIVQAKSLVQEGVKNITHVYDYSLDRVSNAIKARPVAALAIAFVAGLAAVALTRSAVKSKLA